MKRLSFLLSFLLIAFCAQAQTVTLSGQVTDQLTGAPIANHIVYLSADSSSGVLYWAVDTTDANGNYSDVASIPANTAVNFYISTTNCQGQWLTNNASVAANGTTTGLPSNFSICDSLTTGGCNVQFTSSSAPGGTGFTFVATASNTANTSYAWDFGDGTTWNASVGASSVYHNYTSAGTFIVCVTTVDSASCTATFCDSVVVVSTAACRSLYTYNTSGVVANRVYFYGSPTPSFGNTYSWDMGDGSTYTTRNVTHNYQLAGTYSACLTITNNNGCSDTYCDSIVITQSAGPCVAAFTSMPDSSATNTILFTNTSTYNALPAQASWDFGDGSSSRGFSSTSHTYLTTGTFTVCLTITSGNCSDTTCQTVTITSVPPTSCQAGFNFTPSTFNPLAVSFNSTSTSSQGQMSYAWDFGDGATRTGANPYHTYTTIGTYNVCLVITVGNCSDSVCQTITVTGGSGPYTINGTIFTSSNNIATDGVAYLITYDSATQTLALADSMIVDTVGYYYFQLTAGMRYTVKAALNPGDPNFANFLPTYLGDTLLWSNADFVMANQSHYRNINMIAGVNPGGPGFIAGNVQQGANKKEGDPIAGIPVLLFDAGMSPVAYAYSDVNGNYNFGNLAYGTYYIHPEKMNVPTTPLQVTISAANPSVSGAVMVVNSTSINGFIATGLDFDIFTAAGSLAPNPTTGITKLNFSLDQSASVTVSVLDLSGKVLQATTNRYTTGEQSVTLELSSLPAGVYLVKAAAEGSEAFYQKLVKQ
ncbi:MAG: PKD domain-containing protein [Bacteroidia bacterium]